MTKTTLELDQDAGAQDPMRIHRPLPKSGTRKKVWIDIDNSPHVPFFLPIVEELEKQGIELVLTARNIYQVRELLEFFHLPCKVIGRHYGKNKFLKVLGTCLRTLQLAPTAAMVRPDVAISHGSRAQLLICKALGIPTIMMHDYEYSTKTGFLEPDWVFMPDVIPDGVMVRKTDRLLRYPGLKEDVYIPRFRPDPSILPQLGISKDNLVVTVRPPATEAHYHNPESEILFAETLRLLSSNPQVRAVTLPRNARQGRQLRADWSDLISSGRMLVPNAPLDGLNLIWFSDLVVSGGGTMNREAAALGVPVYSIFRGKIGAVDRYLAEQGRLIMIENTRDIHTKIKLVRWNRPAKPEDRNCPVLRCIVDNIFSVLDSKDRGRSRVHSQMPKRPDSRIGQAKSTVPMKLQPHHGPRVASKRAFAESLRVDHHQFGSCPRNLIITSCAAYLGFPEVTQLTCEPKVAHCIEPLKDLRWDSFLQRHPRASVFHSSPWLQALSRTYGYEPIAYTTSPAGQDLENGIVFCRVESWLTGRRLVSLPFSDHCEPLVDTAEDHDVLSAALEREVERERWSYLEIRPLEPFAIVTKLRHAAVTYAFHSLDLAPHIDAIFSNFHKSSIQRKIRRAEREGLTYREGSTKALLDDYYRLFTLTRKRQGLAPQSRKWFANLMDCFGDALKIRVALKGDRPIAAIVTIRHKDTLTYKYGCCDSRFNNLGCMHLLLWNAIQEAKSSGLRFLDFGRTNADQQGLITFKSRWGATQSVLSYTRYGVSDSSTHLFDLYSSKWKSRAVKYVLKHVSPAVLPMIGRIVYTHIG